MKNWSTINVYLILSLGVVAGAQSGNLVRLGTASPVAIAAYRLLIAGLILAILAGRGFKQLKKLNAGKIALLFCAALALGLHFITWIAAVQHTTVANAAILFATNPVFTSIGAIFFFNERFSKRALIALILGIGGTVVICLGDFGLSRENLKGDVLALICALFFTTYFLLSKKMRAYLDTDVYMASIYLIAGLTCALGMLIINVPFIGYSNRTWLCFLLMALIPTILGHTSINYCLRYMKASTVSIATLAEVPIATLVAALAWGDPVTLLTGLGFLLVIGAVVIIYSEKS